MVFSVVAPPVGSVVTATTCGPITDYDSYLNVLNACSVNSDDTNCVTSDDDDNDCPFDHHQSTVTFTVDGSTPMYFIAVGGYNSAAGNFSLTVMCNETGLCVGVLECLCVCFVVFSALFALLALFSSF